MLRMFNESARGGAFTVAEIQAAWNKEKLFQGLILAKEGKMCVEPGLIGINMA